MSRRPQHDHQPHRRNGKPQVMRFCDSATLASQIALAAIAHPEGGNQRTLPRRTNFLLNQVEEVRFNTGRRKVTVQVELLNSCKFVAEVGVEVREGYWTFGKVYLRQMSGRGSRRTWKFNARRDNESIILWCDDSQDGPVASAEAALARR